MASLIAAPYGMIGPVAISSSLLSERAFQVLDGLAEVSLLLVRLPGLVEELLHLVLVSAFDGVVDDHAVERTDGAATAAQRLLKVGNALAEVAVLGLCFAEKLLHFLLVASFDGIVNGDTVKHSKFAH